MRERERERERASAPRERETEREREHDRLHLRGAVMGRWIEMSSIHVNIYLGREYMHIYIVCM
jgi:hypothetical protein